MRIDIITIFPKQLGDFFNYSILKRAQEKNIVKIVIHDLHNFAKGRRLNVDDSSYGGGAGMVMMIEPIAKCIEKLKRGRKYDEVIFMTPDGELLDQKMSNNFSILKSMIILCGHYKGVDERVREHFITKEISIGNYVLTGGELPAAVFCDSVIRLLPGVISDETSALTDSFQDNLLSPPLYTRPAIYKGKRVPEILLSGNTKKIEDWRMEQSINRTAQRRPDLLGNRL